MEVNLLTHGKNIIFIFLVIVLAKSYAIQSKDTLLIDLLEPSIYEVPETFWEPNKDQENIKALFYKTMPYKNKETRAFAYIGIPKCDKPVPAMVLVHGGGGTAFHKWVKIWNDKGYAAIAMSLEGHMPDEEGNGKHRHDYSGPERVGQFDDIEKPVKEQWMYHAISDIIIGHSLIASLPKIDANRIGITGISWGGILSSLVSGVDSRFKCAMPVYGAGYLYESKGHFGDHGDLSAAFIEKKKFWDPSHQFINGTIPTLWVNSDLDGHFSLNITSHSYQLTQSHAYMSIHPSMPHSHNAGWDLNRVPELYAFADYYLKNEGSEFCKIVKQPEGRRSFLTFESQEDIVEATIYYLKEPLIYRSIEGGKRLRPGPWLTKSAKLNIAKHLVEIELSNEVMTYYVNLKDRRGFITSSVLVELEE